jgi:hypothetical protein
MSISTIAIQSKAAKVARIFDILATIILILGGLGVALAALAGVIGLFTADTFSEGLGILMLSALWGVGVAIYTALIWASITLSTIIAGYISARIPAQTLPQYTPQQPLV